MDLETDISLHRWTSATTADMMPLGLLREAYTVLR
jgi:hypothetical protein